MNLIRSILIQGALITAVVCSTTAIAETENSGISFKSAATQKLLTSQCKSYVEEQSLWKTMKMTLGSDGADKYLDSLCTCASESAANNITAEQAADLLDESKRNKVLLSLATTAIKDCYVK